MIFVVVGLLGFAIGGPIGAVLGIALYAVVVLMVAGIEWLLG